MIKRGLMAFLFGGLLSLGLSAEARGPLYNCQLSGQIRGESVAFFWGGEILSGVGTLTCHDLKTGAVKHQAVDLKLAGGGAGFELSMVNDVRVSSAEIGVNDMSSLYGSFGVGLTSGATLLRGGIEADVALKLTSHQGFSFDLGLQGRDSVGLGAHLYAMAFTIQPTQ